MQRLSFESEYRSKCISADEAAALVRPSMNIHLGGAANVAAIIDCHLADRVHELQDVTVRTYIDTHPYRICDTDPEGKVFQWYSGFILGFTRSISKKRGIGVYVPSSWHNVPSFIRNTLSFDVFFLVTPPMTESGFFNFGLTAGETMAIADVSKTIVAVVRKDMPTVLGGFEECLPISRIDYVVEDDETHTFCLPSVEATDADRRIAENILNAGLIQDGSTLQIGIGGLPNSVLELIQAAGLRNLGLHTEMLTEKMMDLIEAGIVTNRAKHRDRLKTVFTFCLGSRRLYDFVDRNPLFATYPVNYTNHPMVIADQPRMFSLNSAAQVDLTGQIASEQIGGSRPFQISGTGGQLDFVMGTMFAKDGQGVSVIALYSEYNGASKIVPLLETGTNVTVPRSLVDHVATEWGIAGLRGLTVQERAQALIAIAHPQHREWLMRQAREAGLSPYRIDQSARPKGVIVHRT